MDRRKFLMNAGQLSAGALMMGYGFNAGAQSRRIVTLGGFFVVNLFLAVIFLEFASSQVRVPPTAPHRPARSHRRHRLSVRPCTRSTHT